MRDGYERDAWWSPGQIIFTKEQTLWLIKYIPVISLGMWPPQGDSVPTKSRQSKAPFELPILVWVDLEARLKCTEADGLLLITQVRNYEMYLYPESRNALAYICGRNAKVLDYKTWLRQRRWRQKQARVAIKGGI